MKDILSHNITKNEENWYVLITKPKHEKKVFYGLTNLDIINYLPLHKQQRIWNDRKKWVETVLFPSYIFIKIDKKCKNKVFEINGILKYLSNAGTAAILKEEEIERIKKLSSYLGEIEIAKSNIDHMISEFLENEIISISICPRQCCKTWNTSYSQMIRFITIGTKNADQFSGTSASIKLSEHQYQQLVPMCKLPVFTSIGGILHQTPKKTLGNKLYYLTENIFAIVHSNPKFVRATNVAISNCGHTSKHSTI